MTSNTPVDLLRGHIGKVGDAAAAITDTAAKAAQDAVSAREQSAPPAPTPDK